VGIRFKFLREIKVNSVNNCNFFLKCIISLRGGHRDCWPLASKYLAMPLPRHVVYVHSIIWGWVQTYPCCEYWYCASSIGVQISVEHGVNIYFCHPHHQHLCNAFFLDCLDLNMTAVLSSKHHELHAQQRGVTSH